MEGGRGTGVGQTFPWQDPRDTTEARVQPVKERMRARQSISCSHLHNKWGSHIFSSTRSLARTPFVSVSTLGSSAHANAGSETGMERGGGGKAGGYLLEWHSANTNSMSVSETPQVCGVVAKCIAAESLALVTSAFKPFSPNN